MKTITLAFDATGKASIFVGPGEKSVAHRKARFVARDKMPAGVVRLETYTLDAVNRVGAVSEKSAAAPTEAKRKK